MSGAPERPSGIKRLEKKKGRFWGFLRREAPGMVAPLSPIRLAGRLRHLLMSTVKTTSSFLRSKMGERGLTSMFEHQAEEYAVAWRRPLRADRLASSMIKFNFQPLGMEAEYSGDDEVAKIVVKRCPLPQRFLKEPQFLEELTFETEQEGLLEGFAADTLTAKGEWPPKKVESCYLCRIIMPRMGEKLGFTWEHGFTDDRPPRCFFMIKVRSKKQD